MHHITRRLSPSLILAIVALFVALAGTAVAEVIIETPDQLGDNVVTDRAIDSSAVTDRAIASNAVGTSEVFPESINDTDLSDPQLKVRALASGAVFSGSDGTVTRVGTGTYNVTFDASALNAKKGGTNVDTLLNNNCAFTATPRNKMAMMEVDGPLAGAPNTVTVRAAFPDTDGLVGASDTQFDITASC